MGIYAIGRNISVSVGPLSPGLGTLIASAIVALSRIFRNNFACSPFPLVILRVHPQGK